MLRCLKILVTEMTNDASTAKSPAGNRLMVTGSFQSTIAVGRASLLVFSLFLLSSIAVAASDERILSGHAGEIFALAFAPDDQLLASAGGDRVIRLWDPNTGREAKALSGHVGDVRALAFAKPRTLLASGGSDGTIRIWDYASGQELKSLSSRFGRTRALAFSPDGQIVASGGDDGTVRIWDWNAGKELRAMKARGAGIVHALVFSPDGKTVVSGGSDTMVHLWDLASGIVRQSMSGHSSDIFGLAFSADGSTIASVSADGTVRLWDGLANRERSVMTGHAGAVHAVAFWPNGRTVCSAGVDGTVRLWDVATATERTTLRSHSGPVWAVALSSDASLLATAGRDQRIVLRPPTPVAVAAALADKIQQRGDEAGPAPTPPPLPAAEILIKPANASAGSSINLTVRVNNKGRGPLYRMQAKSRSDDPAFDGQLFYFGKIDAGRSADDSVSVQIPADHATARVPLEIIFEEYNGFIPDPLKANVNIRGGSRPVFAYTYQIIDDGSGGSAGNGDGRIQKGEAVDLALTVKNVGQAAAQETALEITGPRAGGFALRDNQLQLGALAANESKTVRINLTVRREFAASELNLRLYIREKTSNAVLDEPLKIAIDTRAAPQIVATNKVVMVKEATARIRSGAGAETQVMAAANKDQLLAVTGELGDWYRVQVSDKQTGWIAKREVAEAPMTARGEMAVPTVRGLTAEQQQASAPVPVANTPPVIALASPADGAQLTVPQVQLVGAAASEKGLAVVEIRVNGQLLNRRDARGIVVKPSGTPAAPAQTVGNLDFSERIVLREGKNEIVVMAIDKDNLSSTRTLSVTRTVDQGKIWAVVIGISKYRHVQSLKYGDKDALAMYEYLVSQVGVPKDQITLMLNEQASLTNLKRVLGTELRRKAAQKDTVIIYYAGHGAPETDATSADDDGLEKYLVPYEGDPNDLYTTGLPMREVETILARLSSERVIFITDACYSGATTGRTFQTAARRATVSDSYLARLSKAKGRVVMTASRASEVSEERDNLGHGVFTYYLLEGLKGRADVDGDGVISVDEAYNYVAKRVPEVTGQNQHPVKRGEVEGQLILGRVK